MDRKVDLNLVMQLNEIFEEKDWNKQEEKKYVYESLCSISEHLDDNQDEKELFIDLIKRYQWMSYNDYSSIITQLLENILVKSKLNISKCYVFPILKPEDSRKNKSGKSISYMMKCKKPFIRDAKDIKLEEISLFDELKNLNLKENEYLILADDYIGSGETLFACIKEINNINENLISKIIIATIALQNDTVEKLSSYKLFYGLSVSKGISDYYHGSEIINRNINTMLQLEKKLISGKMFSLGYEGSEGLITMLRTPDNTFPIFWHKYKKNIDLTPPFPRE
ncbi:hypothetical protein [uncultured Chryseobacterium sp.]|uniref:phosphoribosyltransferase-like protein n=1 Tax=uncultured Chryseobacterium sp. TaxID=259322 RepID=UPI0025D23FE1|nr:hypothetical protein [uncultured Chryseobacterium sp.]